MAYANRFVTAMLFVAIAMGPQCTKAQVMDAVCAVSIPEIVTSCYALLSVVPSEDCCNHLKTANPRETTCLCEKLFTKPDPLYANITKVYYNQVNTACNVTDKYTCSGGAMNKIAASMTLFGLVATLFF